MKNVYHILCLKKVLRQFYLHATQTISSKTFVKRYTVTAKAYDPYKRNPKIAQKNVHRPNSTRSIYIFHPTYSKNIGQMQGRRVIRNS